jgi:hypothetical protein
MAISTPLVVNGARGLQGQPYKSTRAVLVEGIIA